MNYPVYEYMATNPFNAKRLYAHSFSGMKKKVKEGRWKFAWISCQTGALSYGQNVVDEYPYTPRYK